MCTKEEFARLRDVTRENTKAITELQKADATQSEQIKTLFNTTKEQGANQRQLLNRLDIADVGILLIVVIALVFGALGERGFNGVTKAAPNLISVGSSPSE